MNGAEDYPYNFESEATSNWDTYSCKSDISLTFEPVQDVRIFLVKEGKHYELTYSNFFGYTPLQQQGLMKLAFTTALAFGRPIDYKAFVEKYDLLAAAEDVVFEDGNASYGSVVIYLD